ncbi:YncE family protein [Ferruginivarius sediminum]|uniref:YncE family protein n=1 Tax=Ferruginivarius sediminum TaxID=2661937 RepID=A0A369T6A7_9PROT|nr:YncE family protein [Ferruginivarius sediminum]RDD60863.1 YncE family protein [Ferruginivarius sediminum]
MKFRIVATFAAAALAAATAIAAQAEARVLAMVNYESKPPEALQSLKHPVPGKKRTEGIAIIDVDPSSATFGEIVRNIELPPDLVAHHLFYNRDASKIYVTALAKGELRVIDMRDDDMAMKVIDVPECEVGEDVVFSEDNTRWYLTCMGSHRVVVGDAVADTKSHVIDLPKPYAHGIAIHDGIDRILVTSTVRPTDLGDAGDTITVLKASTGKVMGVHRVSNKPEPGGDAPVEVLFVPGSNPPVAYITNMYGNALWTAIWDAEAQDFTFQEAYSFADDGVGVPLEIYFSDDAETLYVTTAKPGHLHVFDLSEGLTEPRLVRTVAAGEGAHHVAFNRDMSMGWVQNSLLNLPGMSDGSITVVDLKSGRAVASVDTLKEQGFNPNCIVLLPEWNHPAGH